MNIGPFWPRWLAALADAIDGAVVAARLVRRAARGLLEAAVAHRRAW